MYPATSPLLTDLYQLNMLQAYLDHGQVDTAVFEFFVRRLPARRGFLMAAGLEHALDFLENLQISKKGPADFVTSADQRTEKILVDELSKARPGYGFLLEERGAVEGPDKTHRFIIDPIDCTTNFMHGLPQFAISIALEREGVLASAVVFNPVTHEMFYAERGHGAYLNEKRLRVAARKNLNECLIASGAPFMGKEGQDQFLAELRAILDNTEKATKDASAAAAEVKALSGKLQNLADQVNDMIGDNRKNVDKSLANLEYILRSVAQNIDSITRNIDGTARNMSEFSRLIRQNPGLLLNGGTPEADQGLTPASSAGQ